MCFTGNSFQTIYYFCKEFHLRSYRVPCTIFSSFTQQLWNMTLHWQNFSLILLSNKSEHMVKIDNIISMNFAKMSILVLLSKSSMYSFSNSFCVKSNFHEKGQNLRSFIKVSPCKVNTNINTDHQAFIQAVLLMSVFEQRLSFQML